MRYLSRAPPGIDRSIDPLDGIAELATTEALDPALPGDPERVIFNAFSRQGGLPSRLDEYL
jgi:hypothetical protein